MEGFTICGNNIIKIKILGYQKKDNFDQFTHKTNRASVLDILNIYGNPSNNTKISRYEIGKTVRAGGIFYTQKLEDLVLTPSDDDNDVQKVSNNDDVQTPSNDVQKVSNNDDVQNTYNDVQNTYDDVQNTYNDNNVQNTSNDNNVQTQQNNTRKTSTKNGEELVYRNNGSIEIRRFWKDGKLHGVEKFWDENGTLKHYRVWQNNTLRMEKLY